MICPQHQLCIRRAHIGISMVDGLAKRFGKDPAAAKNQAAAKRCGIDNVKDIRKKARDAAGDMHDSVHKPT